MNGAMAQTIIFPSSIPAVVVYAAATAGAVAWLGIRRLAKPSGRLSCAMFFCARVILGFFALLCFADAFQRHVIFATNWPIALILAAMAIAVETVVSLYKEENAAVAPKKGRIMTAARVVVVILLGIMLTQPVLVSQTTRHVERTVALLFDRSSSMQVTDKGLTPSEKLRMAELLSHGKIKRPYSPEKAAELLAVCHRKLKVLSAGLSAMTALPRKEKDKFFDSKASSLRKSLRSLDGDISSATNSLTAPLAEQWIASNSPLRSQLADLLARLDNSAAAPLRDALKLIESLYARDRKENKVERPNDYVERLLEYVNKSATSLADLAEDVAKHGRAIDEAWWAALGDAKRLEIESATLRSRFGLARDIVLTAAPSVSGSSSESFVRRLEKSYSIQLYSFDSDVSRVSVKHLSVTNEANKNADIFGGALKGTDIAAALNYVSRDVPADKLAGVILLTDGRHNGSGHPEDIASSLGTRHIPINCVMFGAGVNPPPDAGFLSIDAPDTVYTNDRVLIAADVKVDGFQGSNVLIQLYRNDVLVATTMVSAASQSLRTRAHLADTPGTNGMHIYRLAMQPFAGEATFSNNFASICVTVTDDKVKLLLVEGWPRWEYRFIKNLFETRDPSVFMQHVLLHPDILEGVPPQAPIHASVSRPEGETEATALPKTNEEWRKFDVVILGDISPEDIGEEGLKAIRQFVLERGGTLAVIAGPRHMPHAFGGTPLAELLPVTFVSDNRARFMGPEESFKISLTAEGKQHMLTRLASEGEGNEALWNKIPEIRWRHGGVRAKEGASVLAFAVPIIPEAPILRTPTSVPTEEALLLQQRFERENPLIAVHNAGMGRVVFVAFDHLWRLRYRAGEKYHHGFWGQVLRWGVGEKLAYGTAHVRLSASRSRYTRGETIRIIARLADLDWSPINNENVSVEISKNEQVVLRKTLPQIPGSAGLYSAEIGELPPGQYRMDLDSSAAHRVLRRENAARVSAWFSVNDDFPHELGELAADTGFLKRLSDLSGGTAVEPDRIFELLNALGEPSATITETRQRDLWNSWPLLLLLASAAGIEWILRKRGGLP